MTQQIAILTNQTEPTGQFASVDFRSSSIVSIQITNQNPYLPSVGIVDIERSLDGVNWSGIQSIAVPPGTTEIHQFMGCCFLRFSNPAPAYNNMTLIVCGN